LKERIPQYNLEEFFKLLQTRTKEIDDQLYDLLLSFTDFQSFKEMMLGYKKRNQLQSDGFNMGLSIQKADIKAI
jgi:hypothetical protein